MHQERTLSPAKAGEIYGRVHPSPVKSVKVGDKVLRLNRRERRRWLRGRFKEPSRDQEH